MLPLTFGAWMAEQRRASGHSLRQVGEILHVSHERVRQIENGDPAKFEHVVRASALWGVNAWELLSYYEIEDPEVLIILGSHQLPDQLPRPGREPDRAQ